MKNLKPPRQRARLLPDVPETVREEDFPAGSAVTGMRIDRLDLIAFCRHTLDDPDASGVHLANGPGEQPA